MDLDFIGVKQSVGFDDSNGHLITRRQQLITSDFKQDLQDAAFDNSKRPEGNFMKVASIPSVFVEKWLNDKSDPLNIYAKTTTAKMIVSRLRKENLEAFLATRKRV